MVSPPAQMGVFITQARNPKSLEKNNSGKGLGEDSGSLCPWEKLDSWAGEAGAGGVSFPLHN